MPHLNILVAFLHSVKFDIKTEQSLNKPNFANIKLYDVIEGDADNKSTFSGYEIHIYDL